MGKDGVIEASSSEVDYSHLVYLLNAPLVPGRVTFSDPINSPITGSVVVEAAYSNDHRTVVALLDLGEIASKLVLISQSPNDRLGVVDSQGRYLACNDPSRVQSSEKVDGAFLVPGPARVKSDGLVYYASSKSVQGTSWKLLYLRLASEADAPMAAFVGSILILVVSAIIVTAVIAFFAWKIISTPLSALVSRIDLIADGRYSERVEGQFSSEFMEIGQAFNEMAESIERRDRELFKSEERFRLLFFRNRVPTLIIGSESGIIRGVNDAALEYYGYDKGKIIGLPLAAIDESSDDSLAAVLHAASQGGEGRYFSKHRLASGEKRDVELYASPVELDGKADLYCVVLDITQRRIAEERMASALNERTLLLREVYHRVKNNLQIISSLLNLQADSMADQPSQRAMRIAQDRVYAMSLAHEMVYQMPDLASIEVSDYTERLVSNLQSAYGFPDGSVMVDLCPMRLELERAVPYGLALNELTSNALKYASPSPSSPVRISLEQIEGACELPETSPLEVLILVEDSGPGVPAEVIEACGRGTSLGLSLISALARQLGGVAFWGPGEDGKGTRAGIRFFVNPIK